MEFAAVFAVVAKHGAMELQYHFASGCLMESVNILGDNGSKLSLLFKLCQLAVGCVGCDIGKEHLVSVETVEFFGISPIKGMT